MFKNKGLIPLNEAVALAKNILGDDVAFEEIDVVRSGFVELRPGQRFDEFTKIWMYCENELVLEDLALPLALTVDGREPMSSTVPANSCFEIKRSFLETLTDLRYANTELRIGVVAASAFCTKELPGWKKLNQYCWTLEFAAWTPEIEFKWSNLRVERPMIVAYAYQLRASINALMPFAPKRTAKTDTASDQRDELDGEVEFDTAGLWDLADKTAEQLRVGNARVSLNKIVKFFVSTKAQTKENAKFLQNERGWSQRTWLIGEHALKGWIDPAFRQKGDISKGKGKKTL